MKNAPYIIKRLLWMIPTFVGIVTITFLLTKIRPDPVSQKMLSPEGMKDTTASEKYIEELRKFYGYDQPVYVQYVRMWKNILTLDFSTSRIDHRPVIDKIKEALPVTLALNIITIAVIYVISIPLGVYSALGENTWRDRALTLFLYVLYSLPSFWIALLLIKYASGGDYLDIFPLGGLYSEGHETMPWYYRASDVMWHLFLPVVVSVYGSFAFMSRFIKTGYMEALKSEYIRTARAAGYKRRRIIYVFTMKNSLIPLVTLMAGLLPELFGGSVIIESIFSIPGTGKLAFESIYSNDETVIMAIVAISAILTMVGILLADLLYPLVDPRIGKGEEGNR